MTSSRVRIKGLVPLSRLMPSTPGNFRCSLMVPAQCLEDPFLHRIVIGSAILVPSGILISLSLACNTTYYKEKVKIHLVITRMRLGVHDVYINSSIMDVGASILKKGPLQD